MSASHDREPAWLAAYGLSDDPKGNTGPRIVERALEMCHGLATLIGLAFRQVEREHRRMVAAEARLADVNKLLEDWACADFPSTWVEPTEDDYQHERRPAGWFVAGVSTANRARIMELEVVLGYNADDRPSDPANVQHLLQKRRQADQAAGIGVRKPPGAVVP